MKCWKVITQNRFLKKRTHYCRADDEAGAAEEIRPLGDGWNIISIKQCSEAELVKNTNRR